MSATVGTPDLTAYDWIVVNSSAGKDSQASLDVVVAAADAAGVSRDRLVVVHCDLGRVEWDGTRELAETQARHYGLRFEVVARDRDLLHQIEFERRMFPSSTTRYCTSDQKTGQVKKLWTALTAASKAPGAAAFDRPIRILNILGLRADESGERAKKVPFRTRDANGRRVVDEWLPIHAWTAADVWARIHASGVPYHPAYDQGIDRLSCVFCPLANKAQWIRSAQLNPDLAAEYVAVEARIGHRFTARMSMADIVAAAALETAALLAAAAAQAA